jgi:hypothetical protein
MLAELCFVVQLAVGLVFLLSSASKLIAPGGFVQGVSAYDIVPRPLLKPVSYSIIVLEGLLAAAHIFGWFLTIAIPIGIVLFGIFTTAVVIALRRGQELPCFCFGQGTELISGRTLARLVLLILCELFLITVGRPMYSLKVTWAELGLALCWATFVLLGGMWCLSIADLIRLLRPTR